MSRSWLAVVVGGLSGRDVMASDGCVQDVTSWAVLGGGWGGEPSNKVGNP